MRNLSVIIPSKNANNFLACASAVRKNAAESRILLINDGMDTSFLPSAGLWPVMEYETNLPFQFSRNVNMGLKHIGIDDAVVLNDDAILLTPGGFALLQQAAEENPEYGVIAATTNNVGNVNQQPRGIGLREDPRMVCFIAVLIPHRTIELVGLLNERFNCYSHQDDDYCYRVRKAGLKIGIHDGCFVDHTSLPSSFRGPEGVGGDLATGAAIFEQIHGINPMFA
jgi:hypothetical protein